MTLPDLINVARVVSLKLAFTDWFFYNLIILINLDKIRYLNLEKTLLFPRNQVICRKVKTWQAPTTTEFNFWTQKASVEKPILFLIFANNSRSKQNKKIQTPF